MKCVIRTPLVVNTVSRPAGLLHFIDTDLVNCTNRIPHHNTYRTLGPSG